MDEVAPYSYESLTAALGVEVDPLGDVPEYLKDMGASNDALTANASPNEYPPDPVRAESALFTLNADDRGRVKYQRRVHAAKAAGVPKEVVRTWSMQSPKHHDDGPTGFNKLWDDFDPTRSDAVGPGSLYYEAKEAGWVDPGPTPRSEVDGNAGREALQVVDIKRLQTEALEPIEYAIGGIFPIGFVTVIAADGGVGKSGLATGWCAHVSAGQDWAGLPVTEGVAMFASFEDPARVVKPRLKAAVTEYGLDWARVERNFVLLDGSDSDGALVTARNDFGNRSLVATSVMTELREHAERRRPRLLVIDNASDVFAADENSRPEVRQFLGMLAQLARDVGVAIVLLMHVNKQVARGGLNGVSFSGNTAWSNSARSRLALGIDDTGYVILRHEKFNLGPKTADITLRWSPRGVLVPVDTQAALATQADEDKALVRAAVDTALAALAAAGEPPHLSTAKSGQNNLRLMLEGWGGLPTRFSGSKANARLHAVVGRLVADGVLRRATVKTPSRHEKVVYVAGGTTP